MSEVIWSWHYDRYIVRSVCAWSSIKPAFIGTQAECDEWISNVLCTPTIGSPELMTYEMSLYWRRMLSHIESDNSAGITKQRALNALLNGGRAMP